MKITRRNVIKDIALSASALAIAPNISFAKSMKEKKLQKLKGNINHSVCQWTFNYLSLDDLCNTVKNIGFSAIDLLKPKDWPTLQKHGIYCSMCYTSGDNNLYKGFNNPENHEHLIKDYLEVIPEMSKYNYKNLICFSGARNGLDDETGMKNCAEAIDKILPLAKEHGVTLIMELLNSKIDHKDYQCDHTTWGVQLCEKINAENFKLLYDIYHMQIDEGDIIRTIKENHQYIAHYHTGGVPGRHEINDTQELHYPAVMRAIIDTGYKGYVAQEFMPTRENKVDSLEEAVKICDV